MKAILYDRFGSVDVMRLGTTADPIAADDEVVVAMRASSVNVIDSRVRDGALGPLVKKTFPKIPGADIAGTVIAVGSGVTRLKPGDEVFGAADPFKGGAFAEKVSLPERNLAARPASMSVEQAAALPLTGLAALYALRDLGRMGAGQDVLIYGSSGSAGLFAIQLAKHFGARVTAVCGSDGVAASREMGADTVIDYRRGAVESTARFDVIVEFSSHFPFGKGRALLKRSGRFIEASPTIPKFIGSMLANPFRARKHLMLQTTAKTDDLAMLAKLADEGRLKITIARTYPLDEAIGAIRQQEKGGGVGKIVILNPG